MSIHLVKSVDDARKVLQRLDLRIRDLELAATGSATGRVAPPAPYDADYVTLSTDTTLTGERVLTEGEGIDFTDGGAGSTLTIDGEDATYTNKGIANFSPTNFLVSSGAVSIKDEGVANAKLAHMAQATLKGRASGVGTGDATDLTATQVRTLLNVENAAAADQNLYLYVEGDSGDTLEADHATDKLYIRGTNGLTVVGADPDVMTVTGVNAAADGATKGVAAFAAADFTAAAGVISIKESGIDHGAVGGLGDDDHPQYIKDSEFTAADEVIVGTGAGTFGQVTLAASQFLAKKAAGAAMNVTAAEARTILNVEDGADVTDATNVNAAGAVMEADFNAQTILAATVDDTPAALTLTEQTILGRLTGGNVAAIALGIADNNILQVDATAGAPGDDEFARFTASGIEGLTVGETADALEGTIDHGNLAGIADDDHTIYLLADGSRNLSDDLLVDTDKKISFRAAANYINSGAAGSMNVNGDTTVRIKIATANEVTITANTMTFEAGIVDPSFVWDTSGRMSFRTSNIERFHFDSAGIDVVDQVKAGHLVLDSSVGGGGVGELVLMYAEAAAGAGKASIATLPNTLNVAARWLSIYFNGSWGVMAFWT